MHKTNIRVIENRLMGSARMGLHPAFACDYYLIIDDTNAKLLFVLAEHEAAWRQFVGIPYADYWCRYVPNEVRR